MLAMNNFYDLFRLRDPVAGTVMVIHLASFRRIWRDTGKASVNDVVDELGELLTKHLPRDSLIGHLAWALYGAFLPHADLDQAEQIATGLRRAAQSCDQQAGRPDRFVLAIGYGRVRGDQPADDLALLAHATARAAEDLGRYPPDLHADLGLLRAVDQVMARGRDPDLPPDARVGDHHLRAFRRIQDRVATDDPAVLGRECTPDELSQAARAAEFFGLAELGDLLHRRSREAIDPHLRGWTDRWLDPLATVDVEEFLTRKMADWPTDFAPTIQ